MPFAGMDVEEVRSHAVSLRQVAAELGATSATVSPVLTARWFRGPEANRLHDEWTAKHLPQLHDAASYIQQVAELLERHAMEQETASSR